jgi:ABC-type branched-subunit amino acid transport system permease subunit
MLTWLAHRKGAVGLLIVLLAVLLFYPKVVGRYWSFVLVLAGCYFLGALGYNILIGLAGQVSFGQSAFFGIGAYASTILILRLGLPVWMAVLIAGILSGLIAYPIGIPALKISGHYLALVTLAFSEGVVVILREWVSMTEGPYGLKVPTGTFGPWALKGEPLYYFVMAFVVILASTAYHIDRSRIGRAFKAIRDGEVAASSLGVNLMSYKTMAFALSGFYTGIGGALMALAAGCLMPWDFDFRLTIGLLAMVVVGGLRSTIVGSALGAVLLTFFPEWTGKLLEVKELMFGLLLLVCFLFLRGGIVGGIKSAKSRLSRIRFGERNGR